mgnify:CR=1 FL=1
MLTKEYMNRLLIGAIIILNLMLASCGAQVQEQQRGASDLPSISPGPSSPPQIGTPSGPPPS